MFDFLGQRKNGNCDFNKLSLQIKDLWNWHNKEDEEGVKIWYMRKSLEDAISKLADCIEKQTDLLSVINSEMKDIRRDFKTHNNSKR